MSSILVFADGVEIHSLTVGNSLAVGGLICRYFFTEVTGLEIVSSYPGKNSNLALHE